MNWINYKKVNLTLYIGLFLITIAMSIWLYSLIELRSNEIMLTTQNLSIEEVWRYEGALQWWKNLYTTAIIPTTAVLTFSGIAVLLSQQILNHFSQKYALSRFEENIKKTCRIDPD